MKRHWRFTRALLVSIFMIAAGFGDSLADSWLHSLEQRKQVRSDTSLSQHESFEIAERHYISPLNMKSKVPALTRDDIKSSQVDEEKALAKEGREALTASKPKERKSLGRMAELLLITTAFIRLQRYQ